MFLSVQQKYIMEILRKLGYIRQEQLRTLVQGRFSELEISECRMAAMLRQLSTWITAPYGWEKHSLTFNAWRPLT